VAMGLDRWRIGAAEWGAVCSDYGRGWTASREITAVATDGAGGLWIATTEGMAVYRDGRWTRPGLEALLPRDGVGVMCALPPHDLGIAEKSIEQHGLAVASKSTLRLLVNGYAFEHLSVGHELPGSRIQALFADRRAACGLAPTTG